MLCSYQNCNVCSVLPVTSCTSCVSPDGVATFALTSPSGSIPLIQLVPSFTEGQLSPPSPLDLLKGVASPLDLLKGGTSPLDLLKDGFLRGFMWKSTFVKCP